MTFLPVLLVLSVIDMVVAIPLVGVGILELWCPMLMQRVRARTRGFPKPGNQDAIGRGVLYILIGFNGICVGLVVLTTAMIKPLLAWPEWPLVVGIGLFVVGVDVLALLLCSQIASWLRQRRTA